MFTMSTRVLLAFRLSTVLVLIAGAPARAQMSDSLTQSTDMLRAAIDAASARDDWAALQDVSALAQRLIAIRPNDPLLAYYRGYALFRVALIASRRADRHAYHDVLEDADRALQAAAAALPGMAEIHALRASVIGQLIGISGNPFVAMRLGPRSGAEMKRALELGPDNPRVWLLRGINTMNTPKMWGGGLKSAEEYLLKARTLFAGDTSRPPNPTWGNADVEIALGQVHLKQNQPDSAHAEFARALALQPNNAWLRDTLMRQAVSPNFPRHD